MQSVKLKDGSYIDAESVWDASQGKTQKDINASTASSISSLQDGTLRVLDLASISAFNATGGRLVCFKIGKLVYLSVADMIYKSRDTSNYGQVCSVSLSSLGLPSSMYSCNNACCGWDDFLGEIAVFGDSLVLRCNGASTTLWGQVVYLS